MAMQIKLFVVVVVLADRFYWFKTPSPLPPNPSLLAEVVTNAAVDVFAGEG